MTADSLSAASAARATRHVFIRDLSIQTIIGVHPHEKETPQTIIISVDLTVREDAPVSNDHIDEVVCYETLINQIKAIAGAGHVNLIELFAERVAAAALEDDRVLAARIRIEKPEAFDDAHAVGIEIERVRPAT